MQITCLLACLLACLFACLLDCSFACLLVCYCLCVSFQKEGEKTCCETVEKTPLHACLFACLLDCLFACLLVCDCLCVSFQKKSEKTCCCWLMILLLVVVGDLARVAQNAFWKDVLLLIDDLIACRCWWSGKGCSKRHTTKIDWFYELEKMATTSTTKPQFAFLYCMHILNYYLQTAISIIVRYVCTNMN